MSESALDSPTKEIYGIYAAAETRQQGEEAAVKLTRRRLIQGGSVAMLGAAGLGCPTLGRAPQTVALAPAPELPGGGRAAWAGDGMSGLARVDVSAAREIRTIVGLRPFRRSGFRVALERLGDKLLMHNYGHGGGGVSLSWGTSHLAMEAALEAVAETGMSTGWGGGEDSGEQGQLADGKACAVLGCGAVGLSNALLMQRQGWQTTIYARDMPPQTTSNVAGALWSPTSVFDDGQIPAGFYDQYVRASRLANRYFQEMVGSYYSVRWIENFSLSNRPQPRPWFERGTEDLYPDAHELVAGDYPFARAHAMSYRTMMIEPHGYLSALVRDFRAAGGRIVIREFGSLDDVASLNEPLIFNCTGLGAKQLVADDEMDPIRGQLTFLLPQPEVDYSVISNELYMFPRTDGILLGGTFERGSWSTEPDEATKNRIIAGHQELFGVRSSTVAQRISRPAPNPLGA